MRISIPRGDDDLIGRECPSDECSPAYFKGKLGTGLTGQPDAFCPYCRQKAPPTRFYSQGQLEYAKKIALQEAQKGIGRLIENAFGLGPSRQKTLGGGLFSMKMEYKPASPPTAPRLVEEELRRDLACPNCHLDHAVYGLAIWCPDCGTDIFMTHVQSELSVVRKMIGDAERRRKELGARVAARDMENALEDTVSIFEAVLRVMAKRHLANRGIAQSEIDDLLYKRVGSRLQNLSLAAEICERELGVSLLSDLAEDESVRLKATFEKRHPITHNLGIVDAKYLQKVRSGEVEGRDVRVVSVEIEDSIALVLRVLAGTYKRLFPADL